MAPIDAEPAFGHVAEASEVERAVARRRCQFATGRRLAHELLDQLGCVPAPLLPGPDRAPVWPAGVVGSITHDAVACVVVAARRERYRALGIDVEPATALDPELLPTVLRAEERDGLSGAEERRGLQAKLVFSAKECVYKALSADVRTILEFHDVMVVVDAQAGRFTARLLRTDLGLDPTELLAGRHVQEDGRFVTALAREVPA